MGFPTTTEGWNASGIAWTGTAKSRKRNGSIEADVRYEDFKDCGAGAGDGCTIPALIFGEENAKNRCRKGYASTYLHVHVECLV